MPNYHLPVRWPDREARLRHLVDQALVERRRRLHLLDAGPLCDADADVRRRAAHLVERMLSSRIPSQGDASRYLDLLAGRLQMASGSIGTMMTSIAPVAMASRWTRALGVAVADIVHYVEACAPPGADIRVYVALGHEDDRLVVAVGAEGDVAQVGPLGATRGYERARAIVRLLGGDIDRGVDGGRMVFGMTFPGRCVPERGS